MTKFVQTSRHWLRRIGLAIATAAVMTTAAPSNANAQAVAATATAAGGTFVAIVTSPVVLGTVTILTGIATLWMVFDD